MFENSLPKEQNMRSSLPRFFVIGVLAALLTASAIAQDNTIASAAGDKYVISAKAGGVNYVEGSVGVVRKAGTGGHLIKGDSLEIGDRVSTGSDGKAEILLNPGSYVRLGGNSAFEFKTTGLNDLQLKVHRGSAIFEVFASNEFKVRLISPFGKFSLVESGVYRIDVSDKDSVLSVWKGIALVGNDWSQQIKSGKAVRVAGTQSSIAKFDRDKKDDLDSWSKVRSKELAKALATLKNGDVRTSLMRSFLGNRWNMYNSFGLWIYNASFGQYCFLPFGRGWSSPYGYGYGPYIGWYQLPPVIYNPPSTGGGNGGGGTPTTTPTVEPRQRGFKFPQPPFAQIQETGNVPGTTRNTGGSSFPSNSSEDRGSSGPIFAPPSAPPSNPGKVESSNPGKQP